MPYASKNLSFSNTPKTAGLLVNNNSKRTGIVVYLKDTEDPAYITIMRPEGGASGNNVLCLMKADDTLFLGKGQGFDVTSELYVISTAAGTHTIHVTEFFPE